MVNDQLRSRFGDMCRVVKVVERLFTERFDETLRDLSHRGRVVVATSYENFEKFRSSIEEYFGVDR